MKIFILSVLILISFAGSAQDTLFTKDGKAISCKIFEIRNDEVAYKGQADFQYSYMNRSNVKMIHYANGSYDLFQTATDSSSQTAVVNGYNTDPQNNTSNSSTNPSTNSTSDPAYNKKAGRHAAIMEAAYIGMRVLGFAARIAIDVALTQNHNHSNNSSYKAQSSGSNHKRGQ